MNPTRTDHRQPDEPAPAIPRARLWLATAPAMLLPFLGSLFYFVLFSEHYAARILYVGTKLFTLLWPVIAVWVLFRARLPRPHWSHPAHRRAIPLGALAGILIAGIAFGLMHTPVGDVIRASSGSIAAKAHDLGFVRYYWFFTIFLSLFHSLLEEYYWRWFVYGNLRRLLKPVLAHGLAAAAFAAHHIVVATQFFPFAWGLALGSMVGVGGLVFSNLYARQKTLVGAWVAHIFIDLALMTIGHQLIF